MSAVETPATDLTEVIGRRTGTGQKKKHMKSETPEPQPGEARQSKQKQKVRKSIQKSNEWRTFLDEF